MSELRFADPETLSLVSRMELVARQSVEGFLSGLHPSPYHGSSVEYADHRPYSDGDEIRVIDWKLLAKTDKYYVKLFEEQTNVRCTIVTDVSNSMSFGVKRDAGIRTVANKLEYAFFLSATLAYLMLRQNDAVGLVLFDNVLRSYLPPRAKASHFRHILQVLEKTEPGGDTRIGPTLHEVAARLPRGGIVILISDLLGDPDDFTDVLAHFKHQRHDMIVMHVMDPDELEFPYERLTRFKDLEGHGMVVTNPASVKRQYLERLKKHLQGTRAACMERNVSYQLATTKTPYDQLLLAYLDRRARMKC
ncbi:MAG: DUF58 domain-containing protein [Phycisphaeraceae bacterium]|jgi:uncharacterized protein (DUF58 family)|nr:DUF58 domain-containing protein [Phycisphaeraceae bacterium]MDP7348499.1 DUF58 domain-containing protein [Phycisphaeraceae bacterium]